MDLLRTTGLALSVLSGTNTQGWVADAIRFWEKTVKRER
jgi:hypothetical protein